MTTRIPKSLAEHLWHMSEDNLALHGPQMSLRRPTWIEPHWQGKADAPIALRPHVTKKSEGAT